MQTNRTTADLFDIQEQEDLFSESFGRPTIGDLFPDFNPPTTTPNEEKNNEEEG